MEESERGKREGREDNRHVTQGKGIEEKRRRRGRSTCRIKRRQTVNERRKREKGKRKREIDGR